jgi:aryl-alcohol dehydrogenase-like predicted oxidoreductase
VEIHVRSLFLQGVLLAAPAFAVERFPAQREWLEAFHAECAKRNVTPQQACFGFFKSCASFTAAVVGVSGASELAQLLAAWHAAPAMDWSGWAVDNTSFTDPRLWKPRA